MKCYKFNDNGALFWVAAQTEAQARLHVKDCDYCSEDATVLEEATPMRGVDPGDPPTLAGTFDQLTAGSTMACLIATTEE